MDENTRENWADEISTFFCTHASDQACKKCYDKALFAFDTLCRRKPELLPKHDCSTKVA